MADPIQEQKDSLIEEALLELSIGDDDLTFLEEPDWEFAVDNALERMSGDVPLKRVDQGEADNQFRLPLPSDYGKKSFVTAIEYPTDGRPKCFINENEWRLARENKSVGIANVTAADTQVTASTVTDAKFYKKNALVEIASGLDTSAKCETNWVLADGNSTTGIVTLANAITEAHTEDPVIRKVDHLLLNKTTITAAKFFAIHYTSNWAILDVTPDIKRAVVNLVAYFIAQRVSASFAKAGEPSLSADSVDYEGKSQSWSTKADEKMENYEKFFNIHQDKPVKANSVRVDVDVQPRWGGRRWLTHRNK